MTPDNTQQTIAKDPSPEKPCLCGESCDHTEQLQTALIKFLEHDVFQSHPVASSGGVAVLASFALWGLRSLKRRRR